MLVHRFRRAEAHSSHYPANLNRNIPHTPLQPAEPNCADTVGRWRREGGNLVHAAGGPHQQPQARFGAEIVLS